MYPEKRAETNMATTDTHRAGGHSWGGYIEDYEYSQPFQGMLACFGVSATNLYVT
jgi:hypothetical protein